MAAWGRDEDGRPVKTKDLEARAATMSADEKATVMLQRRLIDPRVLRMWQGLPLDQYEDMRANVPFVIIAREPQVFNLTLGYGGSADTIIWFLGHFEGGEFVPLPDVGDIMRAMPRAHLITLAVRSSSIARTQALCCTFLGQNNKLSTVMFRFPNMGTWGVTSIPVTTTMSQQSQLEAPLQTLRTYGSGLKS